MRALCLSSLALLAMLGCSSPGDESDPTTHDELVGGRRATDGEYGSAVLLRLGCTASRVGPRHFLTAAHCVWDGTEGALKPGYRARDVLHVTTRNKVGVVGSIVWQLGGFRKLTIENTELPNGWQTAPRGEKPALTLNAPSDVAIIVVTPDSAARLDGIPIATIDLRAVAPGDPLAIMGYGCEKGVAHANDIGENLYRTLKVADVPALEPTALLHPGGISDLSFPFPRNLVANYFFTPGRKLDPQNGASICPGDSGAPVYRRGAAHDTVVGVNAYYSFLPESEDPDRISVTNWHTRFDSATLEGIDAWLRQRGIAVEP